MLIPLQSINGPMRLQDLALMTNTPLTDDGLLLEKFRAHDRVIHDPKTDLYSYKVTRPLLRLYTPANSPTARL